MNYLGTKFIVLSFLLLVRVIVLLNTLSLMLSCSVFSRVCLCVLLLCVRGRPPLWRGTVTVTKAPQVGQVPQVIKAPQVS